MLRILLTVAVFVAVLPMAASAESIFIPQAHNGAKDWFTTGDVLTWIAETNNVMPVSCVAVAFDGEEPIFRECTVVQAQPLTLVWSNELGKVVAQ